MWTARSHHDLLTLSSPAKLSTELMSPEKQPSKWSYPRQPSSLTSPCRASPYLWLEAAARGRGGGGGQSCRQADRQKVGRVGWMTGARSGGVSTASASPRPCRVVLVASGILLDREGCGGKPSCLLTSQRGTKHSVPLVSLLSAFLLILINFSS